MSSTIVQRRVPCLKPSRSKVRVSESKNVSTFSDARLQAVSSRNMYSEQLCTVMPFAMKLWVLGSVRSKTCRLPIGVSVAKRSQLPDDAHGLPSVGLVGSIDIDTTVLSCSDFFPGRSPTNL